MCRKKQELVVKTGQWILPTSPAPPAGGGGGGAMQQQQQQGGAAAGFLLLNDNRPRLERAVRYESGSGGGALLVPNGRPGGSLRQQPDVVESTVSLPLLSPFYDPSLRSPSSSLLHGPASPTPSNSTWAPSLASTPEPRLLGGGGSVPRRRPPHGKPPPPPRTDSLSSRSTHRKRRPLSVPAPCHLSVRGQFDTFGAIENSKIRLLQYICFLLKNIYNSHTKLIFQELFL